MKLTITTKKIGPNGFWTLRHQLNDFVRKAEVFQLLYEGATRLGCHIPSDYYAEARIQIGDTRLHKSIGLKYAHGHKYSEDTSPTEKQLKQTIVDIQSLIDKASETILAPFTIVIGNDKRKAKEH